MYLYIQCIIYLVFIPIRIVTFPHTWSVSTCISYLKNLYWYGLMKDDIYIITYKTQCKWQNGNVFFVVLYVTFTFALHLHYTCYILKLFYSHILQGIFIGKLYWIEGLMPILATCIVLHVVGEKEIIDQLFSDFF